MSKIIEGGFLANLSAEQARKINPDLEGILDLSSNIILFELGMQANGWSEFEHVDGVDFYKSKMVWKVDPEADDLPEEKINDDIGVEVHMVRGSVNGQPKSLAMTILAGKGIYDKAVSGPVHVMSLLGEWDEGSLGGLHYTSTVEIKSGDVINYSRQFKVQQLARFSPIYTFKDTIHYQLLGKKQRR